MSVGLGISMSFMYQKDGLLINLTYFYDLAVCISIHLWYTFHFTLLSTVLVNQNLILTQFKNIKYLVLIFYIFNKILISFQIFKKTYYISNTDRI